MDSQDKLETQQIKTEDELNYHTQQIKVEDLTWEHYPHPKPVGQSERYVDETVKIEVDWCKPNFKCSICYMIFTDQSSLEHHVNECYQGDLNEKPVQSVASGEKEDGSDVTVLMTKEYKGKLFKCTQTGCTKSFKRKERLNMHLREHTGEKTFGCDQVGCNKSSNNRNQRHSNLLRPDAIMTMDTELLISEVFLRPPLWNRRDKNHHNRFVLDKLWNQVSEQIHTTANAARRRWKNVRDKFRTTLASLPKPKSGDAQLSDYKGEWKYFENLFFLKDQFAPRKSSENFGDTVSGAILDESDEDGNENETEQEMADSPADVSSLESRATPPLPPPSTPRQKRRSSTHGIGNELIEIERKRLQLLQEKHKKDEDDEDLNFFKSLLPHVRKLSPMDKMNYRMKIISITQEFMEPKATVDCTTPSTSASYYGNINSPEQGMYGNLSYHK